MKPARDQPPLTVEAKRILCKIIIKEALTSSSWERDCAEPMDSNGITRETVVLELDKRARTLLWWFLPLQYFFVLVTWLCPHETLPGWIQATYNHKASGLICMLACMFMQVPYVWILRHLHRQGKSLSLRPTMGLIIGALTAFPLMTIPAFFIAQISLDPIPFFLMVILAQGILGYRFLDDFINDLSKPIDEN